ncbi:MAG: RHS repeat-associated core domain-containing protein [Candidatus Bathyarchaeia archaeon]
MAYYTQGQGLISQRRGSASYFYHYDGLGSTKALTDSNQNIQASYKYDAWGNILQTSGTVTNPYLYVGELGYYPDGDAGMYLLTQRWYNSVVGRFVVRDFFEVEPDFYRYCGHNPTNYVDPEGTLRFRLIWPRFPRIKLPKIKFPKIGIPGGIRPSLPIIRPGLIIWTDCEAMVTGFLMVDCGRPFGRWSEFWDCACRELEEALKIIKCMSRESAVWWGIYLVPKKCIEAIYAVGPC